METPVRESPSALSDQQREGESGRVSTPSSDKSVDENSRKRKRELDEPEDVEGPRCSERKTLRHDYRQLNDPGAKDPDPDGHRPEGERALRAELVYTVIASGDTEADPKTLEEAKNSPEWPKWEKAIQIWVREISWIYHLTGSL